MNVTVPAAQSSDVLNNSSFVRVGHDHKEVFIHTVRKTLDSSTLEGFTFSVRRNFYLNL